MIAKCSSLLVGVVLFLGSKATVVSGAPARDIPADLSDAFCHGDFSFRTMWSAGLYDAQVEGLILKASDGKPIPVKTAMVRARELAKETKKPGYAAGSCKDGSAWAVVFPSSYAIEVKKSSLNLSRYSALCPGKLEVSFSEAEKGVSKQLIGKKNLYEWPGAPGFISVVCVDKARGPLEILLAPVAGAKPTAPGLKDLTKGSDTDKTLAWINNVRIQNQRNPVIPVGDLNQTAKTLAEHAEVAHDMKLLADESVRLRSKHLTLLGEDRVKAKTLDEALTLLWISPSHRDLLLSEKAVGVGISVVSGGELFLQITLAQALK